MALSEVHGTVAPGFEDVGDAFVRNFNERGEIGAAFAAYHRGVKVVDIWAGIRDRKRGLPWEGDTMMVTFSAGKGMAATAMALAHSRGLFALDQPVARYWPEFGQAGKERITVRQLMAHEAGLIGVDTIITPAILADRQALSDLLARQRPIWEPGTKHAYHAATLGWYQSELLRHVDPQGRSVGQFFRDEIAEPLAVDFYIGLPRSIPDERLATPAWPSLLAMLSGPGMTLSGFLQGVRMMTDRKSLFYQAMNVMGTIGQRTFSREFLALEMPSGSGVGNARALAKVYGAIAAGQLGLTRATMAELTRPVAGSHDGVLDMDTAFNLGFSRPYGLMTFGSDAAAFGCPGMGGTFGFADVKAQVGFGYICNRMAMHNKMDPRAKALEVALYRCLAAQQP